MSSSEFKKPPLPRHTSKPASSGILNFLTAGADFFLFLYSIRLKTLVGWSDNARQILGVADFAIAREGNVFLRHVHPDDRFLIMQDLERALKGQEPYRATYRWIRPDNNELRWLHCRGSLSNNSDSDIFQGVIIDLSPEFTGELPAVAGPDAINNLLASFPSLVFTIDRDLRILRINRSSDKAAFNLGEFASRENFQIGRSILNCVGSLQLQHELALALEEIINGTKCKFQKRFEREDKTFLLEIIPISDPPPITALLGLVSDISQTVAIERELAELQKKEHLRELTSGVTHNFNNALQGIIGHAAAIAAHPEDHKIVATASREILEIAERTSQLSNSFKAQAEKIQNVVVPVDLNLVVLNAINQIDPTLSRQTQIKITFGTPQPVMAHEGELLATLQSLTEMLPWSTELRATASFRTQQIELNIIESGNPVQRQFGKISLSYRVEQAATGLIRELPLSEIKQKLSLMGAKLDQKVSRSRQLEISLYIPSAQPHSAPLAREEDLEATILVVDDDQMVLRTMKSLLSDLGYGSFTTSSLEEALQYMNLNKGAIRLALIDTIMPGINSAALVKKLLKMKNDLIVLGFSGAPSDLSVGLLDAGAQQILKKPLGPQALKLVLAEHLRPHEKAA